jgi:hypothetical protein
VTGSTSPKTTKEKEEGLFLEVVDAEWDELDSGDLDSLDYLVDQYSEKPVGGSE